MIVKIKSDNPNLFDILRKNIKTFDGLLLKQVKDGVAIGLAKDNEYHLIFQDSHHSFSDNKSIDYQSFCNPRVFLTLASELVREVSFDKQKYLETHLPWLNKKVKDLDTFPCSIEIDIIYSDNHLDDNFLFSKYFPEIKFKKINSVLYSLTVTAESIYRCVNLTQLLCMYLAVTNEQPWFVTEDLVEKYIKIIKNIEDVPYFIIYMFAKKCFKTREMFNRLNPLLENATNKDMSLCWGRSQEARLEKIESMLVDSSETINSDIFEIGCGEMDYPKRLIKKLNSSNKWFSHDKLDYSEQAKKIAENKECNNLHFSVSPFSLFESENKTTVLMIEVIEHLELEDAKILFLSVINNLKKDDRLILTTPNRDFNIYFARDSFRHDDHKFEFSKQEFCDFIKQNVKEDSCNVDFFGIGDRIYKDYLSQGVEIIKK